MAGRAALQEPTAGGDAPAPARTLTHPRYRADIDGLRAVAVLPVVAYHAFPAWMKGGFIGVDVFFVISGFLISTILFENLKQGTFSFTAFYARRIRRIFPALLLVLAATWAFGWIALLAPEYAALGRHVAAGAGFVSNFALWSESGYFDAGAESKPLLHLWSLGIEEQFYIAWPLLLWAAWRPRFNLLTITLIALAASLYLGVTTTATDRVAAFYSPLTRGWELLCGAALAWILVHRRDAGITVRTWFDRRLVSIVWGEPRAADGRTLADATSIAGAALLAYGFWRIGAEVRFPGGWALLPVVGAVLLIAAGPQAWINRTVLSNRVAVGFGLISYPLYLWHWPLLSYARIAEGDVPTRPVRIAAVVASIVLAWLTWRFVERPIRGGSRGAVKTAVLVVLMIAVGYVGYNTWVRNGLGFRFPKIVQELTEYRYDYRSGYRQGSCFLEPEQDASVFATCATEGGASRGAILLWGDSHAAHLYPGLRASLGGTHAIVQRTASGCPPMPGVAIADRPHCRGINDRVLADVATLRPERVVLAAIWSTYDLSRLEDTVRRLRALGVTRIDLVGPVPQWSESLPRQLFLHFTKFIPHVIPYRMSFGLKPGLDALDAQLRATAGALGVRYVSPREILCDAKGCVTRLGDTGDTLMAWDYGHLTSAGSTYLVSRFPRD